ncbi:MAG: MarR family transcriptional regulator [Intestinibacter sp.]
MCKNTDINKEFFDAIIRLKRQSHANIKLKDLYASELMGLRIIYKLKMMQDDNSIGVKTSDIGNYLFMKKSATSKMLNNLEDKGYINRLYDKKDRRVTYIDLTQKGIDLLQNIIDND